MSFLTYTPAYRSAVKESINIIKDIMQKDPRPSGYTTHELFTIARQRDAPDFIGWGEKGPHFPYRKEDLPELPEDDKHPIRSVTFLKNVILPLLDTNIIKKTQVTRLIPLSNAEIELRNKHIQAGKNVESVTRDETGKLARTNKRWVWLTIREENIPSPRKLKPHKKPKFAAFGFGEDVVHLNKRRRDARPGKIHTAVGRMRTFEEGVRETISKRLHVNERRAEALEMKLKDGEKEEDLKELKEELESEAEELVRRRRWFKTSGREMLRGV